MKHVNSFNLTLLLFVGLFHFILFDLEAYLQKEQTPIVKYLTEIELTENESGISPIDCVYVINLKERSEKWEYIQEELKKRGVKPNRVNAINGWKLSDEVKQELAGPYQVRQPGGAIGCLLSHISVYKDAYERGFDHIWVLEDDAEFLENIGRISPLLSRLSEIDPEWDVFYTDVDCRDDNDGYYINNYTIGRPGQVLLPPEYYKTRNLVDESIMRIRSRYGTTSMIISKRGVEKLWNYFSHVNIWIAIDCDIHFIPSIRQYSPTFEIVTNKRENFTSDTKSFSTLNSEKL